MMNDDDDDEGSVPGLLMAPRLEVRDRRWAVGGLEEGVFLHYQHWLP